jgi:hypothetical protein
MFASRLRATVPALKRFIEQPIQSRFIGGFANPADKVPTVAEKV